MSTTIYVPGDSGALSMGAESVADSIVREAKKRQIDIELVRNGSRGLYWLEPLVEVETEGGRVAFGPVCEEDVAGLFESEFYKTDGGGTHSLSLGITEEIPYLRQQERFTFARLGITDPLSLEHYLAHQGFRGLNRALAMEPQDIIEEIKTSRLRGRGGAAFPAGIKWQTVKDAAGDQKYIVCNADEGDSGTFADRLLMEGDPFALIEGMVIAGLAVDATEGYIYLRSEYPHAKAALEKAIASAYQNAYLGPDIQGSGKSFELHLRIGAGAYICGEETALLESLEGKRGEVRAKPPLPAIEGLFGLPTVVNNVLTLGTVPGILDQGGETYNALGTGRSRGTITLQLAGNIKYGGLVEVPFGLPLRTLLETYGGASASGRAIRAVQVGGPLGAYLSQKQFDTPLDYESLAAIDALLGHGGVVVFDDQVDMAEQARFAMEFCAVESCGKCTPCRIGSVRGVEVINRIRSADASAKERDDSRVLLRDLCDTLTFGSLCAMGGLTPMPVLSALKHFSEDFAPRTDSPEKGGQ
jgi:formate dehydrogenase iron-sulfur subunit